MKKLILQYGNQARVLASALCGRYHTWDDGQTDAEKQLISQIGGIALKDKVTNGKLP